MTKKLENKAAETLLNEGVKFTIKGVGKLTIKALCLGTMAKIAKHATKIDKGGDKPMILEVIGTSAQYAKPCAKIVSIAILNNPVKIFLFSGILSNMIYWKMTAKELSELITVIIEKSNADFFFYSTSRLAAMNMMKAATKETTVIGEQ